MGMGKREVSVLSKEEGGSDGFGEIGSDAWHDGGLGMGERDDDARGGRLGGGGECSWVGECSIVHLARGTMAPLKSSSGNRKKRWNHWVAMLKRT